MAASVLAQVPKDRQKAAVDNASSGAGAVNETAIAVGEDRVLTVFHSGISGSIVKIGYAFATLSGSDWAWSEEGRIHPDMFTKFTDPSVAYDPLTGTDQGQSWDVQELCEYATNACSGADPDPALDSSLSFNGNFEVRDYIGIAVGTHDVWTSFMGASDDDTGTGDKTLIWSTQITRE